MFLGILTLITALAISAVAIYYSVAGLVAIFAAAALPIMIMGGVLEVSKLVTAVWLHRYWKQATWWLKSYLSVAVVVLMLITSMGIFGFLSKAHIEQTAQSTDNLAQVETLQSEIDRQLGIIGRAENRIRDLENSTSDNSVEIQSQIDKEQERIENAYTRIQPAIEEQNEIIANVSALFQAELERIDGELATLQGYIDAGEIKKAQGMVGTATDGAYGPKTAAAFTAWQDNKRAERAEWLDKIQQAASSPTVVAAREEIARLRNKAEQQIADSNVLINRLRDQLGNSDNADEIQKAIDEQSERVRLASQEIDSLSEQKITLESEYRKLEAEVGPIKYIAEFIYGENADNNMLEEAVRWVIITIIFVFDPLAVLLLIASQYTFEWRNTRKDDDGERLRREYEQLRAQRIIDNPGYNNDDTKEKKDELRQEDPKEEQQDAEELRNRQEEEGFRAETGDDPVVAEAESQEGPVEDVTKDYARTDDDLGDVVPEDDTTDTDESATGMEQPQVQLDENEKREIASTYIEKKESSSVTAESSVDYRLNEQELDDLDSYPEWIEAKRLWKETHPNLTIKSQKERYLNGDIDQLPWETYLEKPQFTEVSYPEGYIQNAEQENSTIWKTIGKNE